jgi:hypothetical protein
MLKRAALILCLLVAQSALAGDRSVPTGGSPVTGTPNRCARFDATGHPVAATADCVDGDTGGGGGAPINAPYWTATANGTLNGGDLKNLGLLTSGLVKLTVAGAIGTPSTYVGTTPCATGFMRALSGAGAETCAAVNLATADVTGMLGIANGGTGGVTASAARTALGLAIGTNVQAWDADLEDLADGLLTGSKVDLATGAQAGVVSTAAQTFAGIKTFANPTVFAAYLVATLPAAASNTGAVVVVTDALTAGSCNVGGGSALSFCRSNGANWLALGDGGSGSSPTTFCALTDVNCGGTLGGGQTGYQSVWNGVSWQVVTAGLYHPIGGSISYLTNLGDSLYMGGDGLPNFVHGFRPDGTFELNHNAGAAGPSHIQGGPGHPFLFSVSGQVNGVGIDIEPLSSEFAVGLPSRFTSATPTLFSAAVRAPVEVVTHSSTSAITATECSGSIITNTGAGGAVVYTLPVAAAGLVCTFQVIAAQTINLNPNGSDRILALTDANGDSVLSPATPGSLITLYSPSANNWAPLGRDGTWADNN